MKYIDKILFTLLLVGALNLGFSQGSNTTSCWFADMASDMASGVSAEFKALVNTAQGADAYRILQNGGRTQLRKSKEALESVISLKSNPSFNEMGLTDDIIGKLHGSQNLAYTDVLKALDDFGNAINGKNVTLLNFSKVLEDLKKGRNFAEGAEWTLRYLSANSSQMAGKKISCEVTETWSEGIGNYIRRADVVDETDSAAKVYYEFKSVLSVPPGKFGDQFIKDLSNPDVNSLDQLKWLFDGRKNPANFQDNMLDAIDNLELTEDLAEKFINTRDIELFRESIKDAFDEIFVLAN